jgi:hypothetical protein
MDTGIHETMKHWCAMLTSNGEALTEIQIKCGIFQRRCPVTPAPLCNIESTEQHLAKTRFGYTLKSGQKIHHLLYMDDLMLYGKKESFRIFSDDISMKFGLEKCARLVVERGKVKQTDDLL